MGNISRRRLRFLIQTSWEEMKEMGCLNFAWRGEKHADKQREFSHLPLGDFFSLESCLSQPQGKQLVSEPDEKQTPHRETRRRKRQPKPVFLELGFGV